jgi:hypothetical protein
LIYITIVNSLLSEKGTRTKNAKHALNVGNGRAIFAAQLDILTLGLGLKQNHITVDGTHFYMFLA